MPDLAYHCFWFNAVPLTLFTSIYFSTFIDILQHWNDQKICKAI